MDFERQLLFFFSALGAFNGLFLSLYFGFFIKNRSRATYFLAMLLFVISVRVTKSVFLTFYPGTSSTFVSIGLTACFLIGPFLYLYTRIATRPEQAHRWNWLWHVVPVMVMMLLVSIYFPYREYTYLWWRKPPRIMGVLLASQWTLYVFAAIYQARHSFVKLLKENEKLSTLDFWIINIVTGGFIIWLAYNTSNYTSYIVGALSFSFTFYITLIIWFFKRRKTALSFLTPTVKYAKKKIDKSREAALRQQLSSLFEREQIHRNPELKIKDVADQIDTTSHELSQFLNDNEGTSFTHFINEYRIHTAKELLESKDNLTLEAIGLESGFKSNSTFYTAFKKNVGITPAQYKKSLKQAVSSSKL